MSRLRRALTIRFAAALTAVACLSCVASAEITSKTHPTLQRILKTHPDADGSRDGVLSFSEYQAYRKAHPPKRNPKNSHQMLTLRADGSIVIADFEDNNLGHMRQWGWTSEGNAFARNFDQGTRLMQRRTVTHTGQYLLSSFTGSPTATGRMLSPEFPIELKAMQFQLSGGNVPHRLCVNLRVEGKVVRTVTGRNDDRFELVAFDVSALRGKKARLEIVDAHQGIWGHINVDEVVQTDRPTARRTVSKPPSNLEQVSGRLLTLSGDQSGALSIANDRIRVSNRTVEIKDLLQAVCTNESKQPKTSSAVRLVDGQVWFCNVLELKDGKLGIQNPVFGTRSIPMKAIASIEFQPGKTRGGNPGTLYRKKGEPIPGKLVWIRKKDVAIDCALGVVPVPRGSITRLVLASVAPRVGASGDAVRLVDGNLLHGRLSAADNRLVLKQATLGELKLTWEQIRSIRRDAGVIWLDRLPGTIVERVGPVLPPPVPELISAERGLFLAAIRMMPRTTTRFTLPAGKGNRVLRATLAPLPGARAAVRVRVKTGTQLLWEKQLEPGSDPIAVNVDLRSAPTATIEVDFGKRIAFPCGVDWRDAHVITKTVKTKKSFTGNWNVIFEFPAVMGRTGRRRSRGADHHSSALPQAPPADRLGGDGTVAAGAGHALGTGSPGELPDPVPAMPGVAVDRRGHVATDAERGFRRVARRAAGRHGRRH